MKYAQRQAFIAKNKALNNRRKVIVQQEIIASATALGEMHLNIIDGQARKINELQARLAPVERVLWHDHTENYDIRELSMALRTEIDSSFPATLLEGTLKRHKIKMAEEMAKHMLESGIIQFKTMPEEDTNHPNIILRSRAFVLKPHMGFTFPKMQSFNLR